MTHEGKGKFDCPMYSKQTNLKGVYSWNKMWSLKILTMLKCDSSWGWGGWGWLEGYPL